MWYQPSGHRAYVSQWPDIQKLIHGKLYLTLNLPFTSDELYIISVDLLYEYKLFLWNDYSFTQFSYLNTLVSAGFRSIKVMLLVNMLNIYPLALDQKGINFICLVTLFIVVSLPCYRFEWREPQSNRCKSIRYDQLLLFLITNNLAC